ncbi:MAG: phosphoenolpyruvate carboxykinase (ATP) [Pirellulaceae bacterium]|jgi:phosphoenolpyruvate carboxykinase (ATP)
MRTIDLSTYGISVDTVLRNASPAQLYEDALQYEEKSAISSRGALIAYSNEKTGRSPNDKRLVEHEDSQDEVWWGPVNVPVDGATFGKNRDQAIHYLNQQPRLYCVDGYAGWEQSYRLKVRVICARPYHALFMYNMLIRPTAEELETFGEPDCVIWNAGADTADESLPGVDSETSVALSLEEREVVIIGTEYAGEMKKAVFTLMNYLMPKRGVLSMHCSATEDRETGESSVLFGLSGTGKTTLSADPHRHLIGDDEHCWCIDGIFNIEGGCYAKAINLSAESEPHIFGALGFGAVLENVVYDESTREVDYTDTTITQNTRGAYPIEHIENAKIPCVATHPKHIIFLTCDAFGVLPPVSQLTPAQAEYHFISGYTAKVAGTEVGVKEPQATFSPCFGGPFLVWHPRKYSELLAAKMQEHEARVWLINTGWTGGPYGEGNRFKLSHTRAILDAIYAGQLDNTGRKADPFFGFDVVTECPGVPSELLIPRNTWSDRAAYDATASQLVDLFVGNFAQYADGVSAEILTAGPQPFAMEKTPASGV